MAEQNILLQILALSILINFYVYCATSPLQKYAARFSPVTIMEGDHARREYPKFKMEVALSFGLDEDEMRFIEAVIEQNFSGNRKKTDEMNAIQQTVEDYMGGYWSLQFFDDPYMFYNTAAKRARQFVVLDVNGIGIGLFREA